MLLLEKSNKVGKKILMSGGGRCNFTNQVVEADNFLSNNPHFCKAALKRFDQWDFVELVESYNIDYEQRQHHQLFCRGTSSEVRDMLLKECSLSDVRIERHCEIVRVLPCEQMASGHRYEIQITPNRNRHNLPDSLTCESLVVATGGLSIPSLGGSGLGYDIASQFHLSVREKRAGLVPLMFSDDKKRMCERLSGISVKAQVESNGQSFTENLLFTHRGLSGPVILQISNYWHPGMEISINLLPDVDVFAWLAESKALHGKILLRTLLNQKLPAALVNEIQDLWWPASRDCILADYPDKRLEEIARHITSWKLKPSGTEGYRTAEVTLGGVDTDGISSKTMEAKKHPGLYFIGEVLDVSGHLGGFNFQWAWSSGYSAGICV